MISSMFQCLSSIATLPSMEEMEAYLCTHFDYVARVNGFYVVSVAQEGARMKKRRREGSLEIRS